MSGSTDVSTYSKFIMAEVFSPLNIFIIMFNILFFLIVLVLFFWFILSPQFQSIVLDKADIISLLGDSNFKIKTAIGGYLGTIDFDVLEAKANVDSIDRTVINNKNFVDTLLGWFIVIGLVTLASLVFLIKHARKEGGGIKTSDWILLLLLVFSFTTEIIFYLVVVKPWQFIGDYELIKTYLGN